MATTTTQTNINSLIIDAQNGDRLAFEELLAHTVSLSLPFLKHHSIADHDCDDIVQEILIGVHRSLPTYQKNNAATAWLYSIIRYKLTDFFRKKYRDQAQELSEDLDLFLLDTDLETDLIKSELKAHLNQALSKLGGTQETVIRLMKLEGLSIREVSEKLKISEANVKTTAFRGLKKLAVILGKNPMFFECVFLLLLLNLLKSKS